MDREQAAEYELYFSPLDSISRKQWAQIIKFTGYFLWKGSLLKIFGDVVFYSFKCILNIIQITAPICSDG